MASSTQVSHDDYTVAWICAVPMEMAAAQILLSFPRLRLGLMVGIGVEWPREETGVRGVSQYDFGKTLRDGRFQRNRSLNKPPQFLLMATSQCAAAIYTFRKHQEMKEQFSRPDRDWLFEPTCTHEAGPRLPII
ncbi:hypothetical protein BDW75DRAFT_229110 [Aspergillus navahoensis]